jgi:hypothetical protein
MAEKKKMGATLTTVARGALPELFERELGKVLENILDPNTPPGAKRVITIKVTFRPLGEERNEVVTVAHATSTLAPVKLVQGTTYVGLLGGRPAGVVVDVEQGVLFTEPPVPGVTPLNPAVEA